MYVAYTIFRAATSNLSGTPHPQGAVVVVVATEEVVKHKAIKMKSNPFHFLLTPDEHIFSLCISGLYHGHTRPYQSR